MVLALMKDTNGTDPLPVECSEEVLCAMSARREAQQPPIL
jgi:hypothetical protein